MNDLHFGVVVGIDRYPNVSGAEDLSYARTDANRFHDWLVSPAGGAVPTENAKLLKGTRRKEYPTQKDVYKALEGWHKAVDAQVAPGSDEWEKSRLYLYGAGHGYAPMDGMAAMLLADASDQALGYHLEIKGYVDWLLNHAPFREVLVFSDCCRRQYKGAGNSSVPPFSGVAPKKSVEVFAMAGYAARRGEDALEPRNPANADDARGVFTGAVLDGLAGSAARNGVVTSASLANYVRSAVEGLTEKRPVPQRVEFAADLAQQITICHTGSKAPRRTVTVQFSSSAYGEAVVKNGSFEVVGHHRIDDGVWTLELEDEFYELSLGPDSGGFQPQTFKLIGEDLRVDA